MNQRKANARYYGFEEVLWDMPCFAPLRKRRPIAELQLLAGLVWAREKGRGPCPTVEPSAGEWSCYEYGARKVQLIVEHRNVGGLLHEMAHALGPWDKLTHGPAFRERCLRLYRTYGDWNGAVT